MTSAILFVPTTAASGARNKEMLRMIIVFRRRLAGDN